MTATEDCDCLRGYPGDHCFCEVGLCCGCWHHKAISGIAYEQPKREPCHECGGMTIPTGTCTTCIVCGATGGCG